MKITNPFEQPGKWFKANLHTHTTNSDGDTDPAERVAQYREAGYDVLAITDHKRVTEIETLNSKELLLIRSFEGHPPCLTGSLYHLVCLNVPKGFEYEEIPADDMIARVNAVGGAVFVAHPYWCGRTVAQILALEGVVGLEVFNSTCGNIGKADSSVHWDYVLAAGRTLPAIAVDDVHRGRDRFLGWTMIKAEELTTESIMEALRTGSYYATCGPEIKDYRMSEGVVTFECSPAREIHFHCRNNSGKTFFADDGELLTKVEFEPNANATYVRATVVDEQGRRAWTNPIVL